MNKLTINHLLLVFAQFITSAHASDHPELSPADQAYSAERFEEAAVLYRKQAELGIRAAQLNLAYMYLDGIGIPQDYQEAEHWFMKAAEQGSVEAQQNLGLLYLPGKLEPSNAVEADKWFRIAKSTRDIQAVEKTMTPAQIAEANKLANTWLAKFKSH